MGCYVYADITILHPCVADCFGDRQADSVFQCITCGGSWGHGQSHDCLTEEDLPWLITRVSFLPRAHILHQHVAPFGSICRCCQTLNWLSKENVNNFLNVNRLSRNWFNHFALLSALVSPSCTLWWMFCIFLRFNVLYLLIHNNIHTTEWLQ